MLLKLPLFANRPLPENIHTNIHITAVMTISMSGKGVKKGTPKGIYSAVKPKYNQLLLKS
jgi:hypothetical protein